MTDHPPSALSSLGRALLLLSAVILAGLIVALAALLHALWSLVVRPLVALSDLFTSTSPGAP